MSKEESARKVLLAIEAGDIETVKELIFQPTPINC